MLRRIESMSCRFTRSAYALNIPNQGGASSLSRNRRALSDFVKLAPRRAFTGFRIKFSLLPGTQGRNLLVACFESSSLYSLRICTEVWLGFFELDSDHAFAETGTSRTAVPWAPSITTSSPEVASSSSRPSSIAISEPGPLNRKPKFSRQSRSLSARTNPSGRENPPRHQRLLLTPTRP